MCHNNNSNLALQDRLRVAGLKVCMYVLGLCMVTIAYTQGLRGVVRKAVGDDLQANIWERTHMEKIVPSVLFNLHDRGLDERPLLDDADDGPEEASGGSGAPAADGPRALADTCLRELIGKASFGNMRTVLKPVLKSVQCYHMHPVSARE